MYILNIILFLKKFSFSAQTSPPDMAEELVSMVTVVSLLTTALFAIVGVAFVYLFAKNFPTEEKIILMWLVFDVLIHLFVVRIFCLSHMSRVMRKPVFGICENKDADQLRGDREADQCLSFRYIASTIPLLPKSKISSL